MKKICTIICLLFSLSNWAYENDSIISLNSSVFDGEWLICPQDEVDNYQLMFLQGFPTTKWVKGIVPGTVFSAYVDAGLEVDPNYGDNAYNVDKKKYNRNFWYRTEIKGTTFPNGSHIWLCFEGINRKADIYFNGTLLGSLDGFMDRGKFDIKPLIKPDNNVLAVLVYVPEEPIPNLASPTYISSAGWDWMPYVPGLLSGITDDVYIVATGDVSFSDPWVRTKVPTKTEGVISLSTGLVNHSGKDIEVDVVGVINPGEISFSKKIRVRAGREASITFNPQEFPQLIIYNPQLWWPNGYGFPNLYTLNLICSYDDIVSDCSQVTFGIKEYSYSYVNGVFQLSINGERIFCKGGNWGMSEYMLRCRGEEYDLKLRLHKEMNYNMIRNWIGSTTDDEFYVACDKYGIMVTDDFWLNSHPNLPKDIFAFNENAVEKIKRLRNHPCIAYWCGDNEGIPLAPLNEWLRENVAVFDGGDRWYQQNSREFGFSGSGPWTNSHPIWYFSPYPCGFGDNKIDGWGFRSEIGTAVFVNYESYKKFMPSPEQWPADKEMLDKHFFGRSAFNSRPEKYLSTVEYNYGKAKNAEDFCIKSQLLNIEVNKAMYEGWQHHLWNDASSILIWMSQSAYPSLVWQTYDYYYDLNGAYWGVKKACEPIHIQWSYADNTVKVINTTLTEYKKAMASAIVYDIKGNVLKDYSASSSSDIQANSATYIMTIPFAKEDYDIEKYEKKYYDADKRGYNKVKTAIYDSDTPAAMCFIRLKLTDEDGNLLSENLYWKSESLGDYRELNTLPPARIDVRTKIDKNGDKTIVHANVNNKGKEIAFAIRIIPIYTSTGDQIVPAIMDENYFTLFPGESKNVVVEIPSSCLTNDTFRIEARPYNN